MCIRDAMSHFEISIQNQYFNMKLMIHEFMNRTITCPNKKKVLCKTDLANFDFLFDNI